uniref:Vacuolar protein-sorting-associated protein 25 n=1 Tax=Panagrellus redivivus TaxID=6233 RepID=A0A7E4ZS25_PANRE
MTADIMAFTFPWEYDFPPFFTIQPNATTREKQLESWGQLVLHYCHANNIFVADVIALSESELFNNKNIHRRLNHKDVLTVLDYLESKKCVEWVDRQKKQCHIHWQTPEQWAEVIHGWARSNGFINSVVTFEDLIEGDDTVQESFHGINRLALLKALEVLQSNNRAAIVDIDGVQAGVKFL